MARLGDICEINMGQSPDSSSYNDNNDGLPFFQGNADFGELYPTVRVWCSQPSKVANKNDILISVRAPIGALNIADCKCCIGRGIAALTVDENVCVQKYLWHALHSKVEELNSKGTGSTFKAINKKILEETEIPLPSLDEQRKIAAVLDKISDLTAKRRRQLDKLDELVKSRFVEMFGNFLGNQGEKTTLSDVCKIITDGTHQPPEFVPSGIPFLFVSNIVTNEITYDAEKFISEDTYNELIKRTPIELGDILLSTVGSYGHPAIVKSDKRFCFQRHIAYLKPKAELVDSVYLHSAILSDDVQRQIGENVKGIAQKTLNLSEIRKIKVQLPSMESQKRFAEMVTHIDKIKLQVRASLDKLEMLKKARMQEYFR